MPPTFSTPAVVLRTADYKEADRMLTLLSPEHGLVSALSRGCRKQGCEMTSASQQYQCGIYFFSKRGQWLSVTQCQLGESYYPLRQHYEACMAAAEVAKLAIAVALPDQADPVLFDLVLSAFSRLCGDVSPQTVLAHAQLLVLAHIGFSPVLDHCVACGESPAVDCHWSPMEGGILCSHCRVLFADSQPMPSDQLAALAAALNRPLEESIKNLPTAAVHAFVQTHVGQTSELKLPSRPVAIPEFM